MSSDLFDDDEEEVFGGLGEDDNIVVLAGDFDKYRDCSDQDDDDLELDDPSPEPDDDDDDDLNRDNPSPEPDDDDDEGIRRRDAIMKEIRLTVSKVEWVNEMPNGWNGSAPQDERECLRAEGLESPATTNRLSVIQPGGQKKFQKNFVPKPTGKAVACSSFLTMRLFYKEGKRDSVNLRLKLRCWHARSFRGGQVKSMQNSWMRWTE